MAATRSARRTSPSRSSWPTTPALPCVRPSELAISTDVTVAPWGRIEGVLKIGKQPAPKRKVSAWMINQGFSGRVDYDTLTDEAGRFVLERVTPGLMSVYRYVDTPDNRGWTPSNPVFVQVSPGQTARVEVGGTGRPVIGRLRVPRGLSLAEFVLGHGDLSTVRPEPRKPDDFPDYTPEQIFAWYDGFNKTAEGKAYQQAERKYAVDLQRRRHLPDRGRPRRPVRPETPLPEPDRPGDGEAARRGPRRRHRPGDPRRPERRAAGPGRDPARGLPFPRAEGRRSRRPSRGTPPTAGRSTWGRYAGSSCSWISGRPTDRAASPTWRSSRKSTKPSAAIRDSR